MQNTPECYGVPGHQSKVSSQIRLLTCSASSTNTLIRTWTTITELSGQDMIYIKDAAAGDRIIIKTPGVYMFEFADTNNAQTKMGITLNADPTVGIDALTDKFIICMQFTDSNGNGFTAGSMFCYPGDVIRAHVQSGSVEGGNVQTHRFKAIRLS